MSGSAQPESLLARADRLVMAAMRLGAGINLRDEIVRELRAAIGDELAVPPPDTAQLLGRRFRVRSHMASAAGDSFEVVDLDIEQAQVLPLWQGRKQPGSVISIEWLLRHTTILPPEESASRRGQDAAASPPDRQATRDEALSPGQRGAGLGSRLMGSTGETDGALARGRTRDGKSKGAGPHRK